MLDKEKLIETMNNDLDAKIGYYESVITILEENESNYSFLINLAEVLRDEPMEFVEQYGNLDAEETEHFYEQIKEIYEEKQELDNLKNQIKNLYHLKKSNMLELPHVRAQRNKAVTQLITFREKVNERIENLSTVNFAARIENVTQEIDKLLEFSSHFTDTSITAEIEDLDLFLETIEKLNLTEEEKTQLMYIALNDNTEIYLKNMKQTQTELEKKQQQQEEKASEKLSAIIRDKRRILKIPEALRDEIPSLLENPITVNNVVTKVNEIEKGQAEETPKIIESKMFDDTFETEEELELEILRERLFSSNIRISNLTDQEQINLLERAKQFCQEHKKLISEISEDIEMQLDNYIDGFSEEEEYRKITYNGMKFIPSNLNRLIAYELKLIFEASEDLRFNQEGHEFMRSKAITRIEDIFTAYDNVLKPQKIEVQEEKEDSHLFFIDGNCHITDENYLLTDLGLTGNGKKVQKQYLAGYVNSLNKIKNRSQSDKFMKYTYFPILKKYKVNHDVSQQSKVIFIPVENDTIIVGARYKQDKHVQKDMEKRIETIQPKLDNLIAVIKEKGSEYKELVEQATACEELVFETLEEQIGKTSKTPKEESKVIVTGDETDRILEEFLKAEEKEIEELEETKGSKK